MSSDLLLPPRGTFGIFRQTSFRTCDQHLPFVGYSREPRMGRYRQQNSIGNIGSRLSQKMAVPSSQSAVPWPNTKDDYELGKVIG